MHPAYFETRFRPEHTTSSWPPAFAIITAYATTGESWPEGRNRSADDQLREKLLAVSGWVERLTGYSPSTGHAEPGWAVDLPLNTAWDIGMEFHQDAIYYVEDNRLFVSHCDARRKLHLIGDFPSRVDAVP